MNLIFLLLENFMNVTERLHILIHISNYFQTLEVMEKTLADKNEPNTSRHFRAESDLLIRSSINKKEVSTQ